MWMEGAGCGWKGFGVDRRELVWIERTGCG